MKIFWMLVFCALVGACAPTSSAPAAPTTAATAAARAPHKVTVIAHRGGWPEAENTHLAFQYGIDHGADVIELDLHLSKDGEPMVIHDETLDRTTNGKGRVADYTQAELSQFDAWRPAPGQPRRDVLIQIPTLASVLDMLAAQTVRAEVEIKVPTRGRYAGIEQKVSDALTKRNLASRVQVSSFDFDTLKDVKRINPQLKTVALLSTDFFRRVPPSDPQRVVEAVLETRAELMAVNKDWLTSALVQAAHARGLQVEVWTVDDERDMQKFIAMGVDGIITNQPALLSRLAAQ